MRGGERAGSEGLIGEGDGIYIYIYTLRANTSAASESD